MRKIVFLIAAISLVACKENDSVIERPTPLPLPEDPYVSWPVKPLIEQGNTLPYIPILKGVEEDEPGGGKQVHLFIDAQVADRDDVWIDLNNNGIKDAQEQVTVFGNTHTYTLTTPDKALAFTIYGKVTSLDVSENHLVNMDPTHNTFLEELYVSHNQLKSLDLSQNNRLKKLLCHRNELVFLSIFRNAPLNHVEIQLNHLNRDMIRALITFLPRNEASSVAKIVLYYQKPDNSDMPTDYNHITQQMVDDLKRKGWTTYRWINNGEEQAF